MSTSSQRTYGKGAADASGSDSDSSSGGGSSGGGGSSRTITGPTNSARTVAGLIGFAVLFSLIGNEAKAVQSKQSGQTPTPQQSNGALATGARIILGGFVAAGLLVALTGAGEAGRKFAVGLSVVTVTTATLVYGGPVWTALQNAVGTKGIRGTGNTGNTTPTAATSPTQGVATAAALAQAA